MTTFQAKNLTPRRGQVMALLAHTTCSKIGSIMLDCGTVDRIDSKGTGVSALVCNGMPLIKIVYGQYVLRYEGDGVSIHAYPRL